MTTLDQNGDWVLGDWVRTNVYAGGALVAAYDSEGLHFQVSNPLGSRRVQTDQQGWYEAAWVELPYGDGPTPVGFQHAAPTAADATPLHFTGKQLDAETQNYYFGARYYNWHTGRFLIPDWSAKVEPVPYAKLDDPQSLNLYAYMRDDPLGGVDVDGHAPFGMGGGAADCGSKDNRKCSSAAEALAAVKTQQHAKGTTSIQTVSATSASPSAALGAMIGEAIDPAGGGVAGALLGSTIGVGGSVSYVPSTGSWFAGAAVTFSPVILSGTGASANDVIVPAGQNPNSIAAGQSYSVTLQPTPLTGTTVVKSPGSGPPVAGPSIGTKVPVAFGASYNFNITPAVNAARSFINNATQTIESWF